MFIDRIDGNVEHNKLSASNVLNILPNDWETIKIKTDLFIKTNAASSTYRINTKKWNQVVSTLIGGTKKDVTIICNYAHLTFLALIWWALILRAMTRMSTLDSNLLISSF